MFQPLTKEQYDKAIASGFSPTQVISMEKQRKAKNVPQEPGYFSRVGGQYIEAGKDIMSSVQKGADEYGSNIPSDRLISPLEAVKNAGTLLRVGLRTAGAVAGATFAPITEAPVIKQGIEAIAGGVTKIPGVDSIIQKGNELAQKHPESAKDIQNLIDILVLTGGSASQKPVGNAVSKAGVKVEKSGIKAAEVAKGKFAQELVMPVETAATKLEQVGRTVEAGGIFKKDIVKPTTIEAMSAKEVAMIPGVNPKNTFQKNFNIVRDYNVTQAKQLEADVAKYDFVIPKREVVSKLDRVAETLRAENPLIVGDAEKTANKLIAGAKKIIAENEGKGSGLLKARKEYDSWVLSQKPKAFDAKAENAFTVANKAIRDTMNTVLDENAVNLGIKDSLQKQSALYRALDNIAPKAAAEANTPILRAFERVGKVLGIKSRLVQGVAAAVGIGGLGAAATFAPAVAGLAGTGFLIYQGGKFIMKPSVRIALGKLLQESGQLISATDKKILQDALTTYK